MFRKEIIVEILQVHVNINKQFIRCQEIDKLIQHKEKMNYLRQFTCGLPMGVYYIFRKDKYVLYDEEFWK